MAEFTEAEIAILKSLASGMLKAMGRDGAAANGAHRTASDTDLDGRYGDPTVRRDPKRWAGASYVGANYSRCPTDYLLEQASFLEWKADKESKKPDPKRHRNGTPYYEYDLKDAAIARGWAARNRGKEMPPPEQAVDSSYADDMPVSEFDQPDEWTP